MAHLRLADAVDAAKTLLQAAGVPRDIEMEKVVAMGLEVDAFTQAIGGNQDPLRRLGQVQNPLLTLGRRAK